jgi:hypothetical protein
MPDYNKIIDGLMLRVFNFNGLELYFIGTKNASLHNVPYVFRDLMSGYFNQEERNRIYIAMESRKSFKLTNAIYCFTDSDDAEYVYDHIIGEITMKKLMGYNVIDYNNGGL